jgi:L-fucose isomerase-like protein
MRYGLAAIARPTFDVAFAQEVASLAVANLQRAGLELVGNSDLCMNSADLAQALDRVAASDAESLILLQASFADSSLAIQAAGADLPLVLWAFPEHRTGGRLRLNSFCGINLAAYALTDKGYDYHWLYQPADDPAVPDQMRELLDRYPARPAINAVQSVEEFDPTVIAAGEAVRERLRSTTIGRVGDRPEGFEPCGYDPGELDATLGVSVDEVPLPVLFEQAEAAGPPDVESVREQASSFLADIDDVDQIALDRSLRLNVGLSRLIRDHGWSGVATRCWPETFTEFGGAACTPMALLAKDGTPGTCEADVYGNITGLIQSWFTGSVSFIADLVQLERESNTGVFWHCGVAPFEMADTKSTPTATIHSNRSKPLLSEFPLKPGRVTLARISRSRGQHRIVVGGGEMVREPLAFSGTAGVMRFDRPVDEVMATVIEEGLEHHFGIVYGDVRQELRALASLLALPTVEL